MEIMDLIDPPDGDTAWTTVIVDGHSILSHQRSILMEALDSYSVLDEGRLECYVVDCTSAHHDHVDLNGEPIDLPAPHVLSLMLRDEDDKAAIVHLTTTQAAILAYWMIARLNTISGTPQMSLARVSIPLPMLHEIVHVLVKPDATDAATRYALATSLRALVQSTHVSERG